MEKKRIISFGKINYYKSKGRKINEVEIDVSIRDWNGYDEVSICGSVWNHIHSDIICGGQCLDDEELTCHFKNDPLYNGILDIWKNCHLHKLEKVNDEYRKDIDFIMDENNSVDALRKYFTERSMERLGNPFGWHYYLDHSLIRLDSGDEAARQKTINELTDNGKIPYEVNGDFVTIFYNKVGVKAD